jgi:hypothetical protein
LPFSCLWYLIQFFRGSQRRKVPNLCLKSNQWVILFVSLDWRSSLVIDYINAFRVSLSSTSEETHNTSWSDCASDFGFEFFFSSEFCCFKKRETILSTLVSPVKVPSLYNLKVCLFVDWLCRPLFFSLEFVSSSFVAWWVELSLIQRRWRFCLFPPILMIKSF